MKRIDKTVQLNEALIETLSNLRVSLHWVVITEAWCGDSAQILPVLNKIEEYSKGSVNMHIILRDDNPEWIENYHTNGSKSIPKLIAFDEDGKELFTWGPRPKPAQSMLQDWKSNPNNRTWDDFEKELHTWYTHDKSVTLQKELIEILTGLNKKYIDTVAA